MEKGNNIGCWMRKCSSLQNSPFSGGISTTQTCLREALWAMATVKEPSTFFFPVVSSFRSVETKHTQLVLSVWSLTQLITLSWWINHVFYSLCQTQYTIYSLANKLMPPKKASHTVVLEFSTPSSLPTIYQCQKNAQLARFVLCWL